MGTRGTWEGSCREEGSGSLQVANADTLQQVFAQVGVARAGAGAGRELRAGLLLFLRASS